MRSRSPHKPERWPPLFQLSQVCEIDTVRVPNGSPFQYRLPRMPTLAISFSDWCVHDPDPEPGHRSDFVVRGCHIVTASRRGRTHYFWGAAFDVPEISDEVAEKTKASIVAAFNEDKHLLEIMQRQIGEDPRGLDYLELTLGAEGAGTFVCQILNKKLTAEGRSL